MLVNAKRGCFLLCSAFALLQSSRTVSGEHKPRWRETKAETIYTERYSNCDYGYYVNLPKGVIAHGSHSPSPNNGVQLDLAVLNTTEPTTENCQRCVWVTNEYNTLVQASFNEIASRELSFKSNAKEEFKVVRRVPRHLAGLTAIELTSDFREKSQDFVEEDIIAYRPPGGRRLGDIIYGISLITPKSTYQKDKQFLIQVVGGFHLSKLPLASCSND